MTRNRCIGWADGDPVTFPKSDGSVRAVGKVIVRKSAKGTWYLKVQLQTAGSRLGRLGEWVWPEHWVIGRGAHVGNCLDCGQAFRTADPDPSGFCMACDRRIDQEHANPSGIRRIGAYLHGARTPYVKPQPYTAAELAEIAAIKAQDENESPY